MSLPSVLEILVCNYAHSNFSMTRNFQVPFVSKDKKS